MGSILRVSATALSCTAIYARFWEVDIESGTAPGRYLIGYSYEVQGSHYVGEFKSPLPYDEGETFEVKVNPCNPERSHLAKQEQTLYWWIVRTVLVCGVAALLIYCSAHFDLPSD